MTTYKGIKGLSIQTVAGDPSNLAAGDIWYDSVARKVQGAKLGSDAWANSNNMNTARYGVGSAGTQTAGLGFGGDTPTPAVVDIAEKYNLSEKFIAMACSSHCGEKNHLKILGKPLLRKKLPKL